MSIFNIFKSKKPDPLPDYSFLGTDMHSHLVPGIDDGSKTLTESLILLSGLYKLGFRKIITTPHIMPDHYRNTPEIINSGLATLKSAVDNIEMPIELHAAAEYYTDFTIIEKIANEKLLTIPGNYVLFEFSYFSPPQGIESIIFQLQSSGYKTILAHPERYIYWHNNFDFYKSLKDRDVYFQVNINSLVGEYSIPVKKIAEKLIKNNLIEFAGTDLHNEHHLNLLSEALRSEALIELYNSGKLMNNKL
ncbi:MAG: hypothetical protein A2033_04245 [Bacteroidetes bacterium GWA2_31_9]|nr:MAG: hypothetical protein A2033_04245 [Bacteroidetes bacterium GWA2_31_9]